jgi:hypothetical protein
MRSSFKDLVETSPSVKMDFQANKLFKLQNILHIRILYLVRMTSAVSFIVHACRLGRRGGNPECGDCGEMGKQLRWSAIKVGYKYN